MRHETTYSIILFKVGKALLITGQKRAAGRMLALAAQQSLVSFGPMHPLYHEMCRIRNGICAILNHQPPSKILF